MAPLEAGSKDRLSDEAGSSYTQSAAIQAFYLRFSGYGILEGQGLRDYADSWLLSKRPVVQAPRGASAPWCTYSVSHAARGVRALRYAFFFWDSANPFVFLDMKLQLAPSK